MIIIKDEEELNEILTRVDEKNKCSNHENSSTVFTDNYGCKHKINFEYSTISPMKFINYDEPMVAIHNFETKKHILKYEDPEYYKKIKKVLEDNRISDEYKNFITGCPNKINNDFSENKVELYLYKFKLNIYDRKNNYLVVLNEERVSSNILKKIMGDIVFDILENRKDDE